MVHLLPFPSGGVIAFLDFDEFSLLYEAVPRYSGPRLFSLRAAEEGDSVAIMKPGPGSRSECRE